VSVACLEGELEEAFQIVLAWMIPSKRHSPDVRNS
jgi:hypothetical protein